MRLFLVKKGNKPRWLIILDDVPPNHIFSHHFTQSHKNLFNTMKKITSGEHVILWGLLQSTKCRDWNQVYGSIRSEVGGRLSDVPSSPWMFTSLELLQPHP